MMKVLHNKKGFTFTELLLILSVIFTISTAVVFVGKKYSEKQMVEGFLRQLTLDLYAVQSQALSEETGTTLQFVSGGTEYVGMGKSRQLLFRRTLPSEIILSPNSPIREVTYHPNGSVEKFGTLQFVTDSGEIITVRLQFGKGRVVLPEF